jgi:predicted RNase H-like nuclease (RuvC/YqgF family)
MKQARQLSISIRGSAMVFAAMLCGIAFLSGCLLMLTLMPSIHKRAVRLTTRHIMDTAPVSMADIHAERDRERAQVAVAIRRLEISIEELKTKCARQSAEVGRQVAEIHRLQAELEKRVSQSAEVGRQAGEIHRLEAELKMRANQSAEIGQQAAEIHRLEAELKKRAALISVLRVRGQAQHAVT